MTVCVNCTFEKRTEIIAVLLQQFNAVSSQLLLMEVLNNRIGWWGDSLRSNVMRGLFTAQLNLPDSAGLLGSGAEALENVKVSNQCEFVQDKLDLF